MALSLPSIVELLLGGGIASVLGSIVGLGGGFIAVPLLRLFFGFAPAAAAAISLVLVFANTASASISFVRQKRVAVDLLAPIAIAAIPGSIGGALLATHVSGQLFDYLYAALLVVIAIDILRRARREKARETPIAAPTPRRRIVAAWLGAGLLIGFVSSLFGIGGGVVAVPLLLYFTKRPLSICTATSTAIIALTAPVGIIVYGLSGDIQWAPAITMGIGGLVGGLVGARLASRISGVQLSVILAVAMIGAAAAMALRHR
ncbi:MAG: sulfite exporter TauE/SafE family protein [Candidatus Eremiobacteraeota bacterium]|nr:sulfite exporter TauE/SafE family protein [Candidatus Eremiobacteraeota bacterium]